MIYYLDTNICIYFLKGQYPAIAERLRRISPAHIRIPAIVKAELLYGAEKSQHRARNKEAVQRFLDPFAIAPFDDASADAYAHIRASLESKGHGIGPNDYIMAATVLAGSGILVTNNTQEFRRIRQLNTENWIG